MKKDNAQLTQRLEKSSMTNADAVVCAPCGAFGSLLATYPTIQNRTHFFVSVYDAVSSGGKSLAQIDGDLGIGASEFWLKTMITEMFTFLGAIEAITAYQIKAIVARIRQRYYYLTPAELTHFFYLFPFGDYGTLYKGETINPQNVLEGLGQYNKEVLEKREILEREQEKVRRQKQKEEDRKGAVSWEQFCKMKGRDPSENQLSIVAANALLKSKRPSNEQ